MKINHTTSLDSESATSRQKKWRRLTHGLVAVLIVGICVMIWIGFDRATHKIQASYFQTLAKHMTYKVEPGKSSSILFAQNGPYDNRLGYALLPKLITRLNDHGFIYESQARMSPEMLRWIRDGYYAPYHEKARAGLLINDCNNQPIVQYAFPERGFATFEQIPPEVVATLLYIENRHLLEDSPDYRNPAIQWSRLMRAVLEKGWNKVVHNGRAPGGSTLATQLEKYRHSPEGQTSSIYDKWLQMMSASMRAYLDGPKTSQARKTIVLDYLNTVPLYARPMWGEVNGLGDGLWVWFGQDFTGAKKIFATKNERDPAYAKLFKESVALLIAQRRPAYYLTNPAELNEAVNTHLVLLNKEKIISNTLRDTATAQPLVLSDRQTIMVQRGDFVERKAGNAAITEISGLLNMPNRYELERLDISAQSTLNKEAQQAVTTLLQSLNKVDVATQSGLVGKGLLGNGNPAQVMYSFLLLEKGDKANFLRIQADNLDKPLDLNNGMRIDLGSTSKLRTLVTYLALVSQLHTELSALDHAELQKRLRTALDPIGRFSIEFFLKDQPHDLRAMLNAAMSREYSANPHEVFFTGGGSHQFGNFHKEDDGKIATVSQALRESLNLPFVRLMRDITRYYRGQLDAQQIMTDVNHPKRKEYLERFADQEGRVFLAEFYNKYKTLSPTDMRDHFLSKAATTDYRWVAALRSLYPADSMEAIQDRLKALAPALLDRQSTRKLKMWYKQYDPVTMSLADRSYVMKVHPLELWLVSYQLQKGSKSSWSELVAASKPERISAYAWLLNAKKWEAQNSRISQMLDIDAFGFVQIQWHQMGYPFQKITPSYASALGASGDRPASLAKLMGILVNDGMIKPTVRVQRIAFAQKTPYETNLSEENLTAPQQVIRPEVARIVLDTLQTVVDNGTARRVRHAFDLDHKEIAVGGKTGTGDQRFQVWGKNGKIITERYVNRSATFVFNIGEKYFGTLTAFVPGADAENFDFTSALPVQLLKILAPKLNQVWHQDSMQLCARPKA